MTQFTANKKPLFDSDIDPKRIKSVADGLRRQGEFESARMLDGYADLLEAQEKAVPEAWRTFDGEGNYDYRDYENNEHYRDWYVSRNGAKYANWVEPLYSHPTPSDAERLAEALQPFANLLQPHHASMPDDRPIYGINKAEITAGDLRRANEALAAHSAQAQPPAASVTDAMVGRAQDCLHDKGKDIGYYHMRAALEAALGAQENPNG